MTLEASGSKIAPVVELDSAAGISMSVPTEEPAAEADIFISAERTHCTSGVIHVGSEALKWTMEMPEDLRYEGLGIFVPGFGGFKGTSKAPTHAMAEAGIASLRYGPLRKGAAGRVESLFHSQEAHVEALEKVAADVLDHKGVQKLPNADLVDFSRFWLVPHSMGNGAATPFAINNSGKVEGISYLATVGYGSPTPFELPVLVAKGLLPAIRHEIVPYIRSGHIDATLRSVLQVLRYYSTNPVRTIGEAAFCLTADHIESTIKLGELGLYRAYIRAQHDILVYPDEDKAGIFNDFGTMPDVGHLFAQLKPRQMTTQVVRSIGRQPLSFSSTLQAAA